MKNIICHKSLNKKALSLILTVLSLLVAPLYSQYRVVSPTETRHRPDSTGALLTGQREMQTFDFEERDVNYDQIPMYWNQIFPQEGFAHYAEGKIDGRFKRSGNYSFLLIPDGGSVAFEYDRRRIPIAAGSDFQITGYVHLENAPTCRARITCNLVDRQGKTIDKTQYSSQLVGPDEHGPDGWARLEVYVPGNFPGAQYLTLGLWLLQEEQWNQDTFNDSTVYRRDVNALVWFDDITVYQLPRVVLRTDKPGNVFVPGDKPNLLVEVAGVTALEYQLRLTVAHVDERLFHDESWILTGLEGEHNVRKIELDQLPAGLYHARLAIISGETFVASRELTFARLASLSGESIASGANFGILALDDQAGNWDALIELTQLSNAKIIKLPVWRRQLRPGDTIVSAAEFEEKLIRLQKKNVEVMATFSEIPDSIARELVSQQRSLLDLLALRPEIWRPQVTAVIAQYARQIPYWQLGADELDQNPVWDPRLRSVMDSLRREFETIVGHTILAAPLNGMLEIPLSQIGTNEVALTLPAVIAAEQIPEYLADARARGLENIWATLEPLDDRCYSRQHRLIDFAKRVAYSKKGLAKYIFIDRPWTYKDQNGRSVLEPTELMLVYRTLADHLGATHYLGQFNLGPDMPALIFDREGSGCLVAWNDHYHPHSEQEDEMLVYLGDNPVQVDLFGNRTVLPSQNGLTRIKLDDWPVILTGIDTRLAALRASLRLEPQNIDASIFRQQVTLKFTNPFKIPISGRFRFLLDQPQYQNWVVEPPSHNFTLIPGEHFSLPLTLKFPRNEIGGRKELDALITLDADRPYQIGVSLPFEIQLAGVEMNIFARRLNPTDLFIQQVVTNISDQNISLQSFIDLPDNNRLERAIPNLGPGITVTKTFHIPNATQWLGQNLRIGLYDPKGTKRINYRLEIN